MREADWERLWSLFERAVALPALERVALLDAECAGQPQLRAELEALLAADDRPPTLLDELLAVAPAEAQPPVRIGPYRVLDQLGRGGMGVVYLAVRDDGVFDQQVAIKLAAAARFSSSHRRRFDAERRLLATLHHPGIARILDGGVLDDGVPYVVMEHVDGLPIDRHCDGAGLDLRARLALMIDICAAVHYAHSRLVIHCDLKPANILVGAGAPKLLDFGLARLLSNEHGDAEPTTGLFATPEYASPEQLRSEPLGTAGDIYSLGVLLCRLITGALPYRTRFDSLAAAVSGVCDREPLAPSRVVARDSVIARIEPRLARRLAGDLDQIVLKAMRKDPGARYASAAQLGDDLSRYLDGRPVLARAVSTPERIVRWVRRHPLATGLGSAALAALLALTAVLALTTFELRETLRVAEARQQTAEAVTGFLADTFSAADVLAHSAAAPTLDDVLSAGTARLQTDLAEQPLTRARLLHTLGGIRRNLGAHDEAERLLREAVALYAEAQPGAPGPALLAEIALAQVRIDQGVLDEAIARLDAVLERATTADLDTTSVRSRALALRAFALQHASRFEEALADIEQALAASRNEHDYHHATLLRRHSSILVNLGRYQEALTPATDAHAIAVELFGDSHERTLGMLTQRATIEFRRGETAVAADLLEQIVAGRSAYLPADHPLLLDARMRLAGAWIELNRLERAAPLMESVLADQRARDPDASLIPYLLNNLSLIRFRQHRSDEAVALAEEALALNRARHGDHHDSIATGLSNLAEFAFAHGDLARAERMQREALEVIEAVAGTNHPDVANVLTALAQTLLRDGREDGVSAMLARAQTIQDQHLPVDHVDRAHVHAARGELAWLRGDREIAAAALGAALALRESRLGTDDPLTETTRNRLVQFAADAEQ